MSDPRPRVASEALVLGVVCSLPAALPAWVRSLSDGTPAAALLVLVGSVSLLVVPLGVWLRHAVDGGIARVDRALLLGAALSSLPLALFGGVLKSTTHHRPLGGATFAVATLCLLTLCFGLAFRFAAAAGHSAVKPSWPSPFTVCCGLSLGATLALVAASPARPSLVDFLALALAVVACALIRLPLWLGRLPLKLPLVLLGWSALLVFAVLTCRDAALSRSLGARAPVSFALLSWLGGGS